MSLNLGMLPLHLHLFLIHCHVYTLIMSVRAKLTYYTCKFRKVLLVLHIWGYGKKIGLVQLFVYVYK